MNYDQEKEMFGTSIGVVEANLCNAYNINMRLMGMLSDVQELIEMGDTQKANQVINRVKYYFSEYTNTRDCINAERNIN
jgi:hypothetical protein